VENTGYTFFTAFQAGSQDHTMTLPYCNRTEGYDWLYSVFTECCYVRFWM